MNNNERRNTKEKVSETRSSNFIAQLDASVPDELKRLNRWGIVVRRFDSETQREQFSVDHDSERLTYEAALAAVRNGEATTLGIFGGDVDSRRMLCSVRFENCRDPETGYIYPKVWRWLRRLPSYAQATSDGMGMQVLMYRSLFENEMTWNLNLDDGISIWICYYRCFFDFNDDVFDESNRQITDCTDALRRLDVTWWSDLVRKGIEETRFGADNDRFDDDHHYKALGWLTQADHFFGRFDVTADSMGAALRYLDDTYFLAWAAWCANKGTYEPSECERKWASFPEPGVPCSSLVEWALDPLANQDVCES